MTYCEKCKETPYVRTDPSKKYWKLWKHSSVSMSWFNWESRRIVGWLNNKPEVGDMLLTKMESGEIGVMKFIKVEPSRDPKDMFFATVEDVGYLNHLDKRDVL